MPTTQEGEQLAEMIWHNDIPGIRRLAPIAGPDYFVRGAPPLVHAIKADNPLAAQALIDAGAYIQWRNVMGENFVQNAAKLNKPRMAAFFIAKGAGTKDDAIRSGAKASMMEEVTRGIEELFKGDVEKTTGVRPSKTIREQWKDLETLYDNQPPQPKPAPEHLPSSLPAPPDETISVRATIIGVAADDTLNIRSGPGMNFRTVFVLENGDQVTITGRVVMNNETDWYPIRIKETTGWARGKYLQRK